MKRALFLIVLALLSGACKSHDENITVIVSLDAFRWDYPQIYDTPCLDAIAAEGVSATMLPSFPASTFPNHYTLATGLVPDHNGIVNSSFWDKERDIMYSMGDKEIRSHAYYYNGEPIWVTAQKQGLKTGNVYWVGSDIDICGVLPTYYRKWYDTPRLSYEERVDDALRLLSLPEEERPRLVMVYFDDPDLTTHEFGPTSIEGGVMVHYLDSLMGVLHDGIKALPHGDKVNLIVTADHGMTDISDDRCILIQDVLNQEWCEHIIGTTPTNIYTKPEYRDSVINALKDIEHISVWKKEEVPAELAYGTNENVGDVVVLPDLGWQFTFRARGINGAHGYAPQNPDMQVAFRACGPDFKQGFEAPEKFINVDVYPLLAHLLGIVPEPVDGRLERVQQLLK